MHTVQTEMTLTFQDDIDLQRHWEPLLSLSSEPSFPEESKEKKQLALKFGWIMGVLVSPLSCQREKLKAIHVDPDKVGMVNVLKF